MKDIEEFFKEQNLLDFSVIHYYLDRALEEKLWNILENDEYVFSYPVPYFNILERLITKSSIRHKIIKITGKRDQYDDRIDNAFTYEYTLVLDDNTTRHLDVSDTDTISPIIQAIRSDFNFKEKIKDTKTISFKDEDIIITDPSYILKNIEEDWDKSECGKKMENLGIYNYLIHDTIYGDWSCTTFNSDTQQALGEFCADTGQVSVFSLNEMRKYNPEIDDWIKNHSWCVTVIPNFTGEVKIIVKHEKEDYTVHVVGEGNINFITYQTGL